MHLTKKPTQEVLNQKVTVEMTVMEIAALSAYLGGVVRLQLVKDMENTSFFADSEVQKQVAEFIGEESYLYEDTEEMLTSFGIKL